MNEPTLPPRPSAPATHADVAHVAEVVQAESKRERRATWLAAVLSTPVGAGLTVMVAIGALAATAVWVPDRAEVKGAKGASDALDATTKRIDGQDKRLDGQDKRMDRHEAAEDQHHREEMERQRDTNERITFLIQDGRATREERRTGRDDPRFLVPPPFYDGGR